jgi:hypothetical protein
MAGLDFGGNTIMREVPQVDDHSEHLIAGESRDLLLEFCVQPRQRCKGWRRRLGAVLSETFGPFGLRLGPAIVFAGELSGAESRPLFSGRNR